MASGKCRGDHRAEPRNGGVHTLVTRSGQFLDGERLVQAHLEPVVGPDQPVELRIRPREGAAVRLVHHQRHRLGHRGEGHVPPGQVIVSQPLHQRVPRGRVPSRVHQRVVHLPVEQVRPVERERRRPVAFCIVREDRLLRNREARRTIQQVPGDVLELTLFEPGRCTSRVGGEPLVQHRMAIVEGVEQPRRFRILGQEAPVEGPRQVELLRPTPHVHGARGRADRHQAAESEGAREPERQPQVGAGRAEAPAGARLDDHGRRPLPAHPRAGHRGNGHPRPGRRCAQRTHHQEARSEEGVIERKAGFPAGQLLVGPLARRRTGVGVEPGGAEAPGGQHRQAAAYGRAGRSKEITTQGNRRHPRTFTNRIVQTEQAGSQQPSLATRPQPQGRAHTDVSVEIGAIRKLEVQLILSLPAGRLDVVPRRQEVERVARHRQGAFHRHRVQHVEVAKLDLGLRGSRQEAPEQDGGGGRPSTEHVMRMQPGLGECRHGVEGSGGR